MEESGCRLALGLLETKLEWMGRVMSCSTGSYLRRAGRHCDPARTAHVPPLPALLDGYVPNLGTLPGARW